MGISRVPETSVRPAVVAPVESTAAAAPSKPVSSPITDQLTSGGPAVNVAKADTSAAEAKAAIAEARDLFRTLAAQITEAPPAGHRVAGFLEMTIPAFDRQLSPGEREQAKAQAAKLMGNE